MSDHLSAGQLAYLRRVVEDEGGMNYEEENQVLAHIDAQADTIQRVRELACSWMLEQEEAEYTEPELLSLDTAAYEIIDALDGGQE